MRTKCSSLPSLLWIALCLFTSVYLTGLSCPVIWADGTVRGWTDGTHDLLLRERGLVGLGSGIGTPMAPHLADDSPQVGDVRSFCAVDFARFGRPYFTEATCRVVGQFCYIFVEDSQWQNGSVTHTDLVKLKQAFDELTPADPSRGIYELETESLGPAPDEIDRDPKIYILILDIPDNYNNAGTFVAGYFEPVNQKRGVFRDPNTGAQIQSNEVEMVYLDSDPLDAGSIMSKEILAHEFQHMIHWRHDLDEDIWVNEGCSDYAALSLCGYGTDDTFRVESFATAPETSLVYWPGGMVSSLANYGAAYLWMVYLHEHYGGVSTISSLIAHPANGISGINAVLSSHGYSQDFADVFSDWKIANYLDDTNFDSGRYGYRSVDLGVKCGRRYSAFPVQNASRYVKSWAADYIEFTGADVISELQIDLAVTNPSYGFDAKIIAMKNGAPVAVDSLEFDKGTGRGHIAIPEFGYAADTIVLVTNWQTRMESDFDDTASYSYSARLGEGVGFEVAVLPNAVYDRYMDIVIRLDESFGTDVPRITITQPGKTLVSDEKMVSTSERVYVYQLYVPRGLDFSEIRWNIYYLGRFLTGGDLGSI